MNININLNNKTCLGGGDSRTRSCLATACLDEVCLGKIVIVNAKVKNSDILNDVVILNKILDDITEICKLSILHSKSHQFDPYGVTICKILSESHISIHTWPEHQSFALDVYSCRDNLCENDITDILNEYFEFSKYNLNIFIRKI
jgi:S-adenosylmethionine decarboxylase proenzyme